MDFFRPWFKSCVRDVCSSVNVSVEHATMRYNFHCSMSSSSAWPRGETLGTMSNGPAGGVLVVSTTLIIAECICTNQSQIIFRVNTTVIGNLSKQTLMNFGNALYHKDTSKELVPSAKRTRTIPSFRRW